MNFQTWQFFMISIVIFIFFVQLLTSDFSLIEMRQLRGIPRNFVIVISRFWYVVICLPCQWNKGGGGVNDSWAGIYILHTACPKLYVFYWYGNHNKILGRQKVTTEKVEVGAPPLDHNSSIMASLSVNVNVLVFML